MRAVRHLPRLTDLFFVDDRNSTPGRRKYLPRSAEIFAGALQDHGRGKLVGARTFGAGTVLEPFTLSNGGELLLAVYEWLTPNGRSIWRQGISPDIPVGMPEDAAALLPENEAELDSAALAKSQDKQLLKAIEVLKEQIHL